MGLTIRITVEERQLPKRNFRGIQTLVGLNEYYSRLNRKVGWIICGLSRNYKACEGKA